MPLAARLSRITGTLYSIRKVAAPDSPRKGTTSERWCRQQATIAVVDVAVPPGGHRRGPAVAADHPADVLIEPHLRAEPRGHQGDKEGIDAPLVEQMGEGPGREGDD